MKKKIHFICHNIFMRQVTRMFYKGKKYMEYFENFGFFLNTDNTIPEIEKIIRPAFLILYLAVKRITIFKQPCHFYVTFMGNLDGGFKLFQPLNFCQYSRMFNFIFWNYLFYIWLISNRKKVLFIYTIKLCLFFSTFFCF